MGGGGKWELTLTLTSSMTDRRVDPGPALDCRDSPELHGILIGAECHLMTP